MFSTFVALLFAGLTLGSAQAQTIAGGDPRCGSLGKCYLVNLDKSSPSEVFNPSGVALTPGSTATYYPTGPRVGWSIFCETSGKVDYFKYFLDNGDVQTHYSVPFWLNGDNSGKYVNKSEYLQKCGAKEIKVKYYTWDGGDEAPCGETVLNLKTQCEPTPTDKPVSAPTDKPTMKPTKAPTDKPTMKPTKAPTDKPTMKPTMAPVCPAIQPPSKCYLWGDNLVFRRCTKEFDVELKTNIGARFSYSKTKIYSSRGHGGKGSGCKINYIPYKKFNSKSFWMRFKSSCGKSTWTKCRNYTPIGIDLDRSDDVERIEGEWEIDMTGDGELDTINEWFAPTEGILIDTAHGLGDGIISAHHLFGDQGDIYLDGYDKLSQLFDSNGDGEVNGGELEGLAIWIDSNSNALVDSGELSTLDEHKIVSISTIHNEFESLVTLADGSTLLSKDVWFAR